MVPGFRNVGLWFAAYRFHFRVYTKLSNSNS